MKNIVIIGNGIAGITAARHIRKQSNDAITVISEESKHFFSRTALMYIYMGHMRYEDTKPYEDWFWEKNKIDLLMARVEAVDFKNKKLTLSDTSNLEYDVLIIATGSKPRKIQVEGEELKGVQGLYSLQHLQSLEKLSDRIHHGVVIGGGLIGIELAEMLHSRGKQVTMLVREPHFWSGVLPKEEGAIVHKQIVENKVKIEYEEEVQAFHGDRYIDKVITKTGKEIPCDFAGVSIGVIPNIDFLRDTELETDRGVLVDDYLSTNQQDVYAIGDCAQLRKPLLHRKAMEQVWYTGRMMGETLANTVCGNKTPYKPGVWFNSAKFFDVEYQTYGFVPNRYDSDDAPATFYWETPDQYKCVRLVFDKQKGDLLGVNTFGIRMRHEVVDRWIREKKSVDEVMTEMRDANFDPEFYKKHEQEILHTYNRQFNKDLRLKKKSWKRILIGK